MSGYQITEKDIQDLIRQLQREDPPMPTGTMPSNS